MSTTGATGRIKSHVGIGQRAGVHTSGSGPVYKNSWDGSIGPHTTHLWLLLSAGTTILTIQSGPRQPGRRLFIEVRAASASLVFTHTGISGDVNGTISCNNSGSDRTVAAGYVVELMQLPSGQWIETYYRQLL